LVKWEAEVTRWLPEVLLSTRITSPTGAAKLIGEISVLGVSLWWDDALQEFGLKANRPVDTDTVYEITEGANLKAINAEDRNDKRLTEIIFSTVQVDPTKSATDYTNFRRAGYTADTVAKGARAYGDARLRKIFSRWFNTGSDSDVQVLSSRLLRRFNSPPIHARMRLDAKDAAIPLTAVLRVTSQAFLDVTGKPLPTLMQVISRSDPEPGHEIELIAQAYQFAGKYGYSTEDSCPVYIYATVAQKARGEFACDDTTLLLPDGFPAYEAI
jgi:hypothetical protein